MHLAEAVRTATNAPPMAGWMDRASELLKRLAATGTEFTSDDLRARLPEPPHLNCIGMVVKMAAEAGIIERCGVSVATGKAARGRRVIKWRGKVEGRQ